MKFNFYSKLLKRPSKNSKLINNVWSAGAAENNTLNSNANIAKLMMPRSNLYRWVHFQPQILDASFNCVDMLLYIRIFFDHVCLHIHCSRDQPYAADHVCWCIRFTSTHPKLHTGLCHTALFRGLGFVFLGSFVEVFYHLLIILNPQIALQGVGGVNKQYERTCTPLSFFVTFWSCTWNS